MPQMHSQHSLMKGTGDHLFPEVFRVLHIRSAVAQAYASLVLRCSPKLWHAAIY